MIVDKDQVGKGAGFHDTQRRPREEHAGQRGVIRHRHLHNRLAAAPARVAVRRLVIQVGGLPFAHMALEKPSLPRHTRTPCRSRPSTSAAPTPLFMFERGWCVTQVPVARSRSASPESMWMQCAARVCGPKIPCRVQPVHHPRAALF